MWRLRDFKRERESSPSRSSSLPDEFGRATVVFRIIHTSLFNFLCYLAIGVLLGTLPGFVHFHLGLSPLWTGVVIGAQYFATLVSRPHVGRMTDVIGSRTTVLLGQCAGLLSGLCILLAAWVQSDLQICLIALLLSRLVLGCGESCVATGSTTWGLGRVGPEDAAQVISWSGIASYGAMAAGAPLGIWLEREYGIVAIGLIVSGSSLLGLVLALPISDVVKQRGVHLPFFKLLQRVSLEGLGLALGTVGFAAIASFTTLYYAHQVWTNPEYALALFGGCFVITRFLFAGAINRWGGLPVAMVSLVVEALGLFILWSAGSPNLAIVGAAISGSGFALVFPALGVEAIRTVSIQDRGTALGVYTAFLDLAMGATAPVAGLVVGLFGYPAIFLFSAVVATCALPAVLLLILRRDISPRLDASPKGTSASKS